MGMGSWLSRTGWLCALLLAGAAAGAQTGDPQSTWDVGRQADGSVMVPTNQWLRPAGAQIEFAGRPTGLALLPAGGPLVVVDRSMLRTIDVDSAEILASAGSNGGHTVNGVVVAADGRTVYTSTVNHLVQIFNVGDDGAITSGGDPITLPGTNPYPTGLALDAAEQTLFVAASRQNSVLAFDLADREAEPRRVYVGAAPYDLLRLGDRLYVSNWGGRLPVEGDRTASSSGTPVQVDERTIGSDGSVSVIDLTTFTQTAAIPVGLLPCGLAASADGARVYVACANSDVVSVIDTARDAVIGEITVRTGADQLFGSGVNALTLSPDGGTLYAACGALNAVAVIRLHDASGTVLGWLPTGWYPGALALSADGGRLFVANTKGVGSLARESQHNSHHHQGSVSLIDLPPADQPAALEAHTQTVLANNRSLVAATAIAPPRPGIAPAPLPERHGEPSLVKHVVYIILENRTYDQVFGDMPEGRGDPSLVLFGEEVTPNRHALARQFHLLDNFYCSGVLSADGHQWATQGYVTPYLEKSFGGFVRSYPYEGSDALAYSAGGFIWDNVLDHGLTFRSYGEMVQARIRSKVEGLAPNFTNIYADFADDGIVQNFEIGSTALIARVQENLCPTTCGFPSTVPDVYRADQFIRELAEFEANGGFPNLSILLLPNDHTNGTSPAYPKPASQVADNDLALGQIIEAVTKSRFWPETAIFVAQDDPQAGTDHIDGHRSPAFCISPWTPRGVVDSTNYTQVGMVKTIELLLGLPPMNQLDALAEPMRTCFSGPLDLTPYTAVPNRIPLDDMNPPLEALSGRALYFAKLSQQLDFSEVDKADEDSLNRILWYTQRGDDPYPDWTVTRDRERYGLR